MLALLLACLPLLAGASVLERLEHRRWVAADGGPSQVGAIVQTADGFLWLGTNDSLMRFDGARFTRFEPHGRNTLNIVSALLADGSDLWVGLRFGGVRRIRHGALAASWAPGGGLPEGAVYGLARTPDGAVWAAVDDGLARFDGRAWRTIDAAWGFPEHKARAVFVDRAGTLWAASARRVLFLAPGARRFADAGVDAHWVSQIAQAPDGALWLTERYRGRVHRLVADVRGVAHGVTAGSLDARLPSAGMVFDGAGALWLGTSGDGIHHVAAPSSLAALASAERLGANAGLSADVVWKLYADGEGNLWSGTAAGLDRFRTRTLMPAGLPHGALNFALAAGPDASLWAGPSNRPALRRAADGSLAQLSMPAPVTAATTDPEGAVWLGGPGGIWRSRGEELHYVTALPSAGASESAVRALVRGADGALWASINRLGLFSYRGGRWQAHPAPSAAPGQRMPVVASGEPGGRLWFGYRDNLAVSRDAAGERRWDQASGLDLGHVTAIAHEGGRTWLGGQRGLGFVEDGRYRSLGLPDNGLFENIYAIVPVATERGADLWLQSKSGIFQIEAGELQRARLEAAGQGGSQGAGHRLRYRSYDLLGGLANDPYQVLPLPTAVRTGDGRLWFSTSAGVAWIDPLHPGAAPAGPQVAIEAVGVDGARLAPDAARALAPGTQRVVFDFTAPSLSAAERLNFRYRLDGVDSGWHDAGRQREAVYTGLRPGSYTFRVLAVNPEGAASGKEARHAFRVDAVFYRRPGFVAALLCAAGAALWLVVRARVRRAARMLRQRLEERHRERERIARELHDTLLQGVNGLVLRIHAVGHALAPGHPARDEIERILQRADQVLVEGRDRVRALRQAGAHDSLHEALRAAAARLGEGAGARWTLAVQGRARALRPAVHEEALRIGSEALANAFAHAAASEVRVGVDYGERALRLEIGDDGCGIRPEHAGPQGRPDHFGMRGMHERARQIGAALSVRGKPGQGTLVALRVPAGRAYVRTVLARWRRTNNKNEESEREFQ